MADMTLPTSENVRPAQGPESLSTVAPAWWGPSRYAFGGTFALSALVTAVAVFLTTATPGDRAGAAASSNLVLVILSIDLLVVMGLAAVIGRRVYGGWRTP